MSAVPRIKAPLGARNPAAYLGQVMTPLCLNGVVARRIF